MLLLLLQVFCVEKCLGDGVLKATVKSFLSCIFQNLSLLDALMEQLHNVLNTALNSGMEMELLFLLCWSCTMFESPSSQPTTSTQSPEGEHFSDNFREIMCTAPTVDDSHRLVHVLKDRQQVRVVFCGACIIFRLTAIDDHADTHDDHRTALVESFVGGDPDTTAHLSVLPQLSFLSCD